MSDMRVPKSMPPETVAWAYRRGVAGGMWMRWRINPSGYYGPAYASTNALRLADRVRIEWMRRHLAAPTGRN